MAWPRSRHSSIIHLGQARLIEKLLEGNRHATLDVLSEIRPKSASIVNRVRAWKKVSIDLARRIAKQLKQPSADGMGRAPPKTSPEPEYLASKSVPRRASLVEIRSGVHCSSPWERRLQ